MAEQVKAPAKKKTEQTSSGHVRTESGAGSPGLAGELMALQDAVGNAAVSELVAPGSAASGQSRLRVSQPNDPAEREAERVAEAVMRISGGDPIVNPGQGQSIQHSENSGGTRTVEAKTAQQIKSFKGGGRPLSPAVRSFFEPRFEQDFSDVRVHSGPKADEAARLINAEAFTLGSDVVFKDGKFQPYTTEGKKLLAHELTHIHEQGMTNRPRIQRQMTAGAGGTSVARPRSVDETLDPEQPEAELAGSYCRYELNGGGTTYRLYGFDVEGARLKSGHKECLRNFVLPAIRLTENGVVRIVGHASTTGSDAYNKTLSRRRAQVVYKWLNSGGVSKQQLREPEGIGESRPVDPATPHSPGVERAVDRAVTIKIESGSQQKEECAHSLADARQIETAAATETLRKSVRVAGRFKQQLGGLSAQGEFQPTILDTKYWFAKLYQLITYYEIVNRDAFEYPSFVMHFIPIFYDMYYDALMAYLKGERDKIHAKWRKHFEATGEPDISSVQAWMFDIRKTISTGVSAHIKGDMADALVETYRSFVDKYCVQIPFNEFRKDFFETNKAIFGQVKGDFLLELAKHSPSPLPDYVDQYFFAVGEQVTGAGLPVETIYDWRADAWREALDELQSGQ